MEINNAPDSIPVAEQWDRVLHLLSQEPRRQIILSLSQRSSDEWVSLPEAAESPHRQESREELSLILRHQHLPKLANGDHVRWRTSPFEVARGERFEDLEIALQSIISGAHDYPDHLVYGCEEMEAVIE